MKRDTTFTFRIPSQLKADLQAIADDECRSLAKQVEKILQDYVITRRLRLLDARKSSKGD